MKKLGSSDSLGALMSICQTTEHSPGSNHVYTREFQTMLEDLDEEAMCVEESGHTGEKKRRLSMEQVKALEKNFEVENKLEPERKVKLARELGLQPRQVAVWFQNRRARWKTKQLERDYGLLKASYEGLQQNYDSLKHDNQALLKEIGELKSKLLEGNTESNVSVKEEKMVSESDHEIIAEQNSTSLDASDTSDHLPYTSKTDAVSKSETLIFPDFKDGSSDSDSSAILTEDNSSPNAPAISSSGGVFKKHIFSPPEMRFNSSSSSSMNCFQFSETKVAYQPQFVKIEEHNFFSGDESCNFFADDQAPTLQWYCNDQWS